MNIHIIAAVDRNNAIGKNNTLPWHIPADLAHFKNTTSGHAILMGRKTYDSIGRPLPHRKNFVLTSNDEWSVNGVTKVASLEEAEREVRLNNSWEPLWVIGGSQVYALALPLATKIVLTRVQTEVFGADSYFPAFSESDWRLDSTESLTDETTGILLDIETWTRR